MIRKKQPFTPAKGVQVFRHLFVLTTAGVTVKRIHRTRPYYPSDAVCLVHLHVSVALCLKACLGQWNLHSTELVTLAVLCYSSWGLRLHQIQLASRNQPPVASNVCTHAIPTLNMPALNGKACLISNRHCGLNIRPLHIRRTLY
jgi:hypothetical protein